MVSLNGNTRQTGQGGMTFFSDSLSSYHDDDPLLDAGMPALPQEEAVSCWMTQEIRKFRTIRTVKVIVLAVFLYACLVASAFLLPLFCQHGRCGGQESTSLVIYVHGGVWFLLVLVHMYLAQEHRASLLHGYFLFHLQTGCLRRLPLYLNSAANALLLVVCKLQAAVCRPDGRCGALTKANYLQILISLEGVIALVALSIYLVKTVRFNRTKDVPDFLRVSSSDDPPHVHRQIGFSAPFNLQTWAMEQCWSEVFHLRRGVGALVEQKANLTRQLQNCQNVSVVIN